jgi:hypothetical protein
MNKGDRMKLWTYHPKNFVIDRHDLVIDAARGGFWVSTAGYRLAAPRLWQLVKTNQFVWCCTVPNSFSRTSAQHDISGWEIDRAHVDVLAFIDAWLWEEIIAGREQDWDGLLIDEPDGGELGIHALVSVPMKSGAAVCHGPLPITTIREMTARAQETMAKRNGWLQRREF